MSSTTFLGRLRRDRRGNTIAIMAAALVPLMGFAGSAVDMARLYVVKVRLQQACDAGALAGRKAMTDTALATPLDNAAETQANAFFNNNFRASWYQTTAVSFTPSKSVDGADSTVANAVQATARATVPMAVMGFFGMPARELVVTCQARYDLADTDVMFVLDTTGSMSCVPSAAPSCANSVVSYTRGDGTTGYYNQESSGSKIQGVRDAVMLFDQTMRANADPTTHFRYGFVTYSSAVNVGGALASLPTNYIQNTTWSYNTRQVSGDYNYGGQTTVNIFGGTQTDCVAKRVPGSGYAWGGSYYMATVYSDPNWNSSNNRCQYKSQVVRAMWHYDRLPVSVASYVSSRTTGTPVSVPGRLDGLTSVWRGCIEEVDTQQSATFSLASLPDDLNPDFVPTNAANMWRPLWPDVAWLRSSYGATDIRDDQVDENNVNQYEDYTYRSGMTLSRSGSVACGMPAQRLRVWTAQQVSDYVNNVDFKPFGGTYHDVGMIWGTRMLSPTSVFADSTPWPGRNEPSRSIVFMTDGNMAPSGTSYGQYGVEIWDQRVSPQGASTATDTDRHNARFRIECDAAKRKGITIYVVALGVAINNDLTYCASPGQTYQASSTAALTDAFRSIAQRIAMLRITQ